MSRKRSRSVAFAGAKPAPVYRPKVGEGLVHRYKAYVTDSKVKTRGRSFAKYKVTKYDPAAAALDIMRSETPYIKWNMIERTVTTLTSIVGRQGVYASITAGNPLYVLPRVDLQKIYHKIYQDTLRPISQGAPVPAYNALSVGNPDLKCHNFKRILQLFNPKNTIVYLTIYEFIPKTEGTFDPETLWASDLTRSTPSVAGNYGLADAKSNTIVPTEDSTRAVTDPFETPHKIPRKEDLEFWHTFGLYRETKIKMEPLSKHNHVVVIPGFTVSHEDLFLDDPGDGAVPGFTMQILLTMAGEKCYDATGGHQVTSYCPSTVTAWYEDVSAWSMVRRRAHSLSWTTHCPHRFSEATAPALFVGATNPSVAGPDAAGVETATTAVIE